MSRIHKEVTVDWSVFESKFGNNKNLKFEDLCYLLFCKEFGKSTGIFSYLMQVSIEANPIEYEGNFLAFQAKFYSGTLSKHAKELRDIVISVKKNYPEVTKLYIYSNKDWRQNNTNNEKTEGPKGKLEVEKRAAELGIKVIWRTSGYFKSQFVSNDSQEILSHFFTTYCPTESFIKKQLDHTARLFDNVKSNLSFNGQDFVIERNEIEDKLILETKKPIILAGEAGVGKTFEIKKLRLSLPKDVPFFAFNASEFNLNRLNEYFGECDVNEFLSYFKANQQKIIFFDSCEKFSELPNLEPVKEFIKLVLNCGWQVIFNTREQFLDDLSILCKQDFNLDPNIILAPSIDFSYLESLSQNYGFTLPSDEKLNSLLLIPFYLNKYLSIHTSDKNLSINSFISDLWISKVVKNSSRRERVIINIAQQRANAGSYFFKVSDQDLEIADSFVDDSILGKDGTLFFFAHDIYEEWALDKLIDESFKNRKSNNSFFEDIGNSLTVRKIFCKWMSAKLSEKNQTVIDLAAEVANDSLSGIWWKDERIQAIIESSYLESFLSDFQQELLLNEGRLLSRFSFILELVCRKHKRIDSVQPYSYFVRNFLLQPSGVGWELIIKFIYDNKEELGFKNLSNYLSLFEEWRKLDLTDETTRFASLVALYMCQNFENVFTQQEDKVLGLISAGARTIKPELSNIFKELLVQKHHNERIDSTLVQFLLSNIYSGRISEVLPDETLELAALAWRKEEASEVSIVGLEEQDYLFGVNGKFSEYPASAFKTPLLFTLRGDYQKSVDFIITFLNESIEIFVNKVKERGWNIRKIKQNIEGIELNQYVHPNLWKAYRSSDGNSYLISSILMSLEYFILEKAKAVSAEELEGMLLYLLGKTNSCAISAIAASVVMAVPEKTFRVAKVIFSVKEFFNYDLERKVSEEGYKAISLFAFNPKTIYDTEREESSNLPHRQISIEGQFVNYQFDLNKKGELHSILDTHLDSLVRNPKKPTDWEVVLGRMDIRKASIRKIKIPEGKFLEITPYISEENKEQQSNISNQQKKTKTIINLNTWSNNVLSDDSGKVESKYDSEPESAFTEIKNLLTDLSESSKSTSDSNRYFYSLGKAVPFKVAANLIKFHHNELKQEQLSFCADLIIERIWSSIFETSHEQNIEGLVESFEVLEELLSDGYSLFDKVSEIVLYTLVSDKLHFETDGRIFKSVSRTVSRVFEYNPALAASILAGYIKLKPQYTQELNTLRKNNRIKGASPINAAVFLEDFIVKKNALILRCLAAKLEIDFDEIQNDLDYDSKILVLMLIPRAQISLFLEIFPRLSDSIFSERATRFLDEERYSPPFSDVVFRDWYADLVIQSDYNFLEITIKPFIKYFLSDLTKVILESLIYAQDQQEDIGVFWQVWEKIFEALSESLPESRPRYYSPEIDMILSVFIFDIDWKYFKQGSWRFFRVKDKVIFNKISLRFSNYPVVLSSLAKLINGKGDIFLDNGVDWINNIINSNSALPFEHKLTEDDCYYLDAYAKKYSEKNRKMIKTDNTTRGKLLSLLNLLIANGQASAYIIRQKLI